MAETPWNVPSGLVQFGLVLLVLRFEGVRLRVLGFGRRQLRAALVTVAGFIIAVNAVVAGLIVAGGGDLSVEPFAGGTGRMPRPLRSGRNPTTDDTNHVTMTGQPSNI